MQDFPHDCGTVDTYAPVLALEVAVCSNKKNHSMKSVAELCLCHVESKKLIVAELCHGNIYSAR